MKRWEKDDQIFYVITAVFVVFSISRFFQHSMVFHAAPLEILQDYVVAEIATFLFLALQLFFYFMVVRMVSSEKRRVVRYIAIFLMIFLVPFYLCGSYFGAMDIYAWSFLFVFIMGLCAGGRKSAILAVPVCFLTVWVSPMSVLSIGYIELLLLYERYLEKKEKVWLWNMGVSLVVMLLALWGAWKSGYFSTDAQWRGSSLRMAAMVIFMSPYLYMAWKFLAELIKGAGKRKSIYVFYSIGGLFPAVVWTCCHDYGRGILYTFCYYLVMGIALIVLGDEYFYSHVETLKDKIKSKLPIPGMVIAYVFIFLTFWVVGEQILLEETVLGF